MSWSVHRRQLITGAGAVFLLPLLERFFPKNALAAGSSDPLRFVSLYMPNGTYNVQGDAVWYPQGLKTGPLSASSFSSRSVFAPFTSEVGNVSVLMHPACSARDKAATAAAAIRIRCDHSVPTAGIRMMLKATASKTGKGWAARL